MSSPFDLTGKVALITGATRGIGLATAEMLKELGASLVLSSEDEEECAEVADRLGGVSLACDMADLASVDRLASRIERTTGALDIAVLNAGIAGHPGSFADLNPDDYRRVMTINLEAPVRLSATLLPLIARRGGGSLILMSSIAGLRGNAGIAAYALSKAALAQLARNLAVEWGRENVRVNAVSPGLIRTPLSRALLEDDQFMARRLQMTPLRRAGEAHEVAGAVAFLASPAGTFVNGHNLVVDGGTTITDGS